MQIFLIELYTIFCAQKAGTNKKNDETKLPKMLEGTV